MPYSEYCPEFMGTAVLTLSDACPVDASRADAGDGAACEAGSMQTFTLVYTAGRFGIDDTGSLKIGFRFPGLRSVGDFRC